MAGLGMKEGEQKDMKRTWKAGSWNWGSRRGGRNWRRQWRALRRGWYVGDEGFFEKLKARLGALVAGKRRESHSGGAKRAHGEAAAEGPAGGRVGGPGLECEGIAEIAQERPGENGAGLVAAGADDGVVALGEPGTGHGALHARDAGGEPDATKTCKEIGEIEATASANGETRCAENQNCHFSRTDPLTKCQAA